MTGEPILGKHPDVDVNANRRAGNADRIRAILQNVGTGHFRFSPGKASVPPAIFSGRGDALAFGEKEDGVDRVGIIDVIGRDARGVGRAGRLRGQFLVKEAAFLDVRREDFAFADVLVADRGGEVFPARILRIGRRIGGIAARCDRRRRRRRRDMA